MLHGLVQPPLPVGDAAHQEVPLPVLGGRGAQQLLRPAQVAQVDGLPGLLVHASAGIGLLLIAALLSLVAGIGGIVPAPSGALLRDLVVGLVDLFHLLLRQIGQRIVLIVVRMVLPGQFPVCALDLVVTGSGLHAQNTVGIRHLSILLCMQEFRRPAPSDGAKTLRSMAGRPR